MKSREWKYLVRDRCKVCGKHLRGGIINFVEHGCNWKEISNPFALVSSLSIKDFNDLIKTLYNH